MSIRVRAPFRRPTMVPSMVTFCPMLESLGTSRTEAEHLQPQVGQVDFTS